MFQVGGHAHSAQHDVAGNLLLTFRRFDGATLQPSPAVAGNFLDADNAFGRRYVGQCRAGSPMAYMPGTLV